MTGHKISLGKSMTVRDGKIVRRPVKLSRPAEYAKRKKKRFHAIGLESVRSPNRSAGE